jgi:hypothetical protein
MGLFGERRAPVAVAPSATKAVLPITSAAPEPPKATGRGLFGSSWMNWRSLGILGAALQQIGGIHGALNDQLGSLQKQQEDALAQQRQAGEDAFTKLQRTRQAEEWGAQDSQQQALQAWVSSLPADQQAAARANPQAAIQAFMANQARATQSMTPYQSRYLDHLEHSGGAGGNGDVPDGFVLDDDGGQ